MTNDARTTAIIVAAGRGTRAGGDVPKQWRKIAGQSVVEHTLSIFEAHPRVDEIVLVVAFEDLGWMEELDLESRAKIALGGSERSGSVLNGLAVSEAGRVLIHDAARCCLPPEVIDRVLAALDTAPAVAPALAVTDALWTGEAGQVTGVQDRNGLFRAQTPQGFHLGPILAAHAAHGAGAADDVEVARRAGLEVAITQGAEENLKITTPGDFARAEALLRQKKDKQMDIRLGNGFDVHRFGDGDHVVLCGVKIPHERGLSGHSDADVSMHAVTDAIYGALAEGDIGRHFPPSDPQWKGADSAIFLKHAVALAAKNGFAISNIDVTLICEKPKIGPHAGAMQARMAELMGLTPDRVSVKATTSERLGFTGREEGIAALASATLVKT